LQILKRFEKEKDFLVPICQRAETQLFLSQPNRAASLFLPRWPTVLLLIPFFFSFSKFPAGGPTSRPSGLALAQPAPFIPWEQEIVKKKSPTNCKTNSPLKSQQTPH
jgi:hypothetical protein